MLLNENENSWVSKVKNILFYCNLQETWQTQTVGNEHQFIEVLKEKLIYFSDQKSIETIQSSRRYDIYKSFKSFRYKEIYISVVNIKTHRKLLARFRMGMSNIFTDRFSSCQIICMSSLNRGRRWTTFPITMLCISRPQIKILATIWQSTNRSNISKFISHWRSLFNPRC